ncbi:MAG TPA: sigma-70 family RNA polymerase sigma factor [Pirellulales bacterium]|nr:sigma-70 family RNA polymerase sigma factor [Pirellulales bacterium]
MSSNTLTIQALSANRTSTLERSDEELFEAYRTRHDRQAFAELVHRYERELYTYLRRYLGDAAMAEDAFQATFLQIHLKNHQFETGRKFRPWLYTIATNQAIDAQRRNKRHRMVSLDRRTNTESTESAGSLLQLLESREAGPTARLETVEREHWTKNAVAELPEALRAVVMLVYYQGLKYHEAAEVLGVPVGTVKSRLHTAILKLNESWGRTHAGEADMASDAT